MSMDWEMVWWLHSPQPFWIQGSGRNWQVGCERKAIVFLKSKRECEVWASKAERTRVDFAERQKADKAAAIKLAAERKAAAAAAREVAAAKSAAQLSFGF